MQKLINMLIISALLAVLTGCSTLKFPGVYRISVQQGNILDQDMIDQLEIGMTRRQVRFVMGSPLIEDTFNPDRWDYYYSLRRGDGSLTKKHLKLFFDGDVLASLDGDLQPTTPIISPEEVKEQLENQGTEMPEDPFEDVLDN